MRSTAGRDRGLFMIVVGIVDETAVLLSDGDVRKVSQPKKKKNKHLAKTRQIIPELQEKLVHGDKIQNAEIRKVLKPFNDNVHAGAADNEEV